MDNDTIRKDSAHNPDRQFTDTEKRMMALTDELIKYEAENSLW